MHAIMRELPKFDCQGTGSQDTINQGFEKNIMEIFSFIFSKLLFYFTLLIHFISAQRRVNYMYFNEKYLWSFIIHLNAHLLLLF